MTTIQAIALGLLFALVIIWASKSIYNPEARWIQAIMFFGKLHTFITNVEGKIIYKGATQKDASGKVILEKWDLIDLPPGEKQRRINLYFFPWPFFKAYTYDLTYTKEKMLGEEQEGDVIVWKDDETKFSVISRSGKSDHLEWRAEYPTITPKLDTKELLSVNVFTNNILEVVNPAKILFGIKDWFKTATDTLQGGLKGLVAEKGIDELNQYSSEEKGEFDYYMREHANFEETKDGKIHRSLPSFGLILFKSVFKDFDPADDKAKEVMDSFGDVTKAKKQAEVDIERAKGKAKAYEIEQEKIVHWRKKYLIDTGLAKTDAAGNITELVPDANVKLEAEALEELSKLTGTLVLDSGTLNKIFNVNTKNPDISTVK